MDDELRTRLGRLAPTVDGDAALAAVVSTAKARRARTQITVVATMIAIVLIGGMLATRGTGSERSDVVVTGGTGAPDHDSRADRRDDDAGTTTELLPSPSGSDIPGSSTVAPESSPSTTASTLPPSKVSVELRIHPDRLSAKTGDHVMIDTEVVNTGTETITYGRSAVCGTDIVGIDVAADPFPAHPFDYAGNTWDLDPATLGAFVTTSSNDFQNMELDLQYPGFADPPKKVCTSNLPLPKKLLPGSSVTAKAVWDVRLAPGPFPANGKFVLSGTFLYDVPTIPMLSARKATATTSVVVIDDPLRSEPVQPILDGALTDDRVSQWIAAIKQRREDQLKVPPYSTNIQGANVGFWFAAGQWVLSMREFSGLLEAPPPGIRVSINASTHEVTDVTAADP